MSYQNSCQFDAPNVLVSHESQREIALVARIINRPIPENEREDIGKKVRPLARRVSPFLTSPSLNLDPYPNGRSHRAMQATKIVCSLVMMIGKN